MAICLIVEGIYDQTVYPVLAKRCRDGVRTITRQCRGPVISKLPGVLDYLGHTQSGIERVLVIFDSDGRNPEELQREVRRKLIRKYGFEVTPIVVVEALEAWLIADPVAVRNHLGNSRNFTNPEGLRHPKSELTKLLPHRKRYTLKSHAGSPNLSTLTFWNSAVRGSLFFATQLSGIDIPVQHLSPPGALEHARLLQVAG
jgi:hypothetical protein